MVAGRYIDTFPAGAVSPAHSMISDLYPPEQRTSAMSTFVAGANLGILLAFLVGGVAGQLLGWRWAFVIAGIPGLMLAVTLWLTVKEPAREPVQIDAVNHRSLLIATCKTV